MNDDYKKLFDAACAARDNAHCPISHFPVGAALETDTGEIFAGCNVESVAFTTSTHAETNAIDTAIAAGAKGMRRIMVVLDAEEPGFSCALCRQRIIEFGSDAEVIAATLSGKISVKTIKDLYPDPFVAF
jgi:cytidine deaminase